MDNMKREFKCDITSHPSFIDACTMRGRYFPCPFCGSEKPSLLLIKDVHMFTALNVTHTDQLHFL